MSATDNYEFSKSMMTQDDIKYTPYSNKQFNYINDINNGVYTNASQSLVTFDLSSIYNSTKFVDASDSYITIPIVIVSAFSSGAALVAPGTVNGWALTHLTTNNINLIHQSDLNISGVTIEQTNPYQNKYVEFKMLSEMSINDLKTIGPSLGFSDHIDNPYSVQFAPITTATASYSGNGVCNNRPFSVSGQVGQQYLSQSVAPAANSSSQNHPSYTVNNALSQRVGLRYVDTTASTANVAGTNIYGTSSTAFLMSPTQLANEFKPYYTILNTNYLVCYDVCVIRCRDLFDSMNNWGLCKRFDGIVRLYVNTGSINISVTSPNTTTIGYYSQLSQSTFTNTCPLVVNYLPYTNANGGVPATTTNIITGCYIARPTTTNLAGINLNLSGASHPMSACRFYYSQIDLKPEFALRYVEENRAKKIVYRNCLTNNYTNITSGGSFSQLVQSGITSPHSVLIMPYIDSSATAFGSGNFPPGGSPFNTNVADPLSLINIQVSLGGVNQLSNTMYYTYDEFLSQVNIYESLTSSDIGISAGLLSKDFWEMNRVYVVNLLRGNRADALTQRNVSVSFVNNNNCAISVLVFIVYLDECVVDVETGLVRK